MLLAIPPRKLHGVNPTSLFKKSSDKNVNKLANAKNTNGKNKANVDKNKDNTEWLSDDEEAGTDYWAKHSAACEPSNERPYKSFCDPFNAADFSDDEDVPTNNKSSDNKEIQTILIQNTQKSFNEHKLEDQPTSSNSIKNAIKEEKTQKKRQVVVIQSTQKPVYQKQTTTNEIQKINKRLVPVQNSSFTSNRLVCNYFVNFKLLLNFLVHDKYVHNRLLLLNKLKVEEIISNCQNQNHQSLMLLIV